MAKRKKDDDQDELSERLARAGASKFSRSQQVLQCCDFDEILKMQAIDPSTGLPVGVTQEDFDKRNDDYRKMKGFDTNKSAIDPSTGLPVGVTQEDFDKNNSISSLTLAARPQQ